MHQRCYFKLAAACAVFGATPFSFPAERAAAYDIVNRWSATQVDGGGLQRGDPVTLRWSIVPDGESYSRASESKLIQYLDDGWNIPAAQRTSDLTNRSWWTVMDNAYAQFARVSGIRMVYVAERFANGADSGLEGDIRIGGDNIDGTAGGVLADNVFPDNGDMRIDTSRETNGQVSSWHSTEPALRNLMIHETGHGVGLGHAQNTGVASIMEGGLRTDIWGFQFDDVYALNRQYGDPLERNGGNDTSATATPLGNFTLGQSISLGRDAVDSSVSQFDDDWLGIDGTSDTDWFKFTTTAAGFVNMKSTPLGPSYVSVQQGNFNAAAQSDLWMYLIGPSPAQTWIQVANKKGLGEAETIGGLFLDPGEYRIRIRGTQDANQFYQLDLSLTEAPATGTSVDLNLDGLTTIPDWMLFQTHSYTTFAGLGQRDAFQRGDLDFDGDNDVADFRLFKSIFNSVNGAGAFETLVGVPEPSSLLLGGGFAVVVAARRKQLSSTLNA